MCSVMLFGYTTNAYDKKKFEKNDGFTDKLVVEDSGTKKNKKQKPVINPDATINFPEYFDLTKCELINPCKPCNFKEM